MTGVIQAGVALPFFNAFASIGDFNEDGWLEPIGFLNNGDGTFSTVPSVQLDAILALYPGRISRDTRIFDIDGDGHVDVVWNVYTDPSVTGSFTLVLHGDGAGGFDQVEEWQDVRGYGETIVSADFNNDGLTDVFIPVYTHVDGSDSNYLFLNQGGGTFGQNVALDWGVGLSFLPAALRVEGAQGADVNFDGKIDLFVGSHLFINQGNSFAAQPLDQLTFDEGANLFDYDNDGDFDLVLRGQDLGPRLYESVNGQFIDRGILSGTDPILGFGLNVADIDGNGWQDIIVGGQGCISIFFNVDGTFTRYATAFDVSGVPDGTVTFGEEPCCGICQHGGPGVCEALAVADFDGDGSLDIIGKAFTLFYFKNDLDIGDILSLNVLGANGQQDQFGRSVRLTSHDQPGIVMARSVESGSGYLSQNQYEMLIGLPVAGAYDVEIAFANGIYEFVASAGQDISAFADGRVSITGSGTADVMGGGTGADTLAGAAGDDHILASAGADAIDGGADVDTLDFANLAGPVTVDLTLGTATVGAAVQTLLSIENLVGTAFADTLTAGAGASRLEGGAGNDVYFVNGAANLVVESAGGGSDEVRTTLASYVLPANVEKVTGLLDSGQSLTGNGLANTFAGGAGGDTFVGGLGDDTYAVGAGDTVTELLGEGTDSVLTALGSYALPNNVENLTGTASTGQILSGNSLSNTISGGAGADTFAGGAGDDLYVAGAGDTITELANEGVDEVRTALASFTLAANIEILTGTASVSQLLIGNASDNTISGGDGADILEGGAGSDIYIVGSNDTVNEAADSGTDEVRTSVSIYTLTANVENLTGTASTGQKLVGNSLGNVIRANSGFNNLIGRQGDDVYWISNASTSITEKVAEGYDTIRSSVSFVLDAGIEIELLAAADETSTAPLNLTGNEFANTVIGNAGSNVLNGNGGTDTLIGLGGDDFYAIDSMGIAVVEAAGGGSDIVLTSVDYVLADGVFVESLSSRDWSATYALSITGNALANVIVGNAGANVLDGGGGTDILQGLGGNDTYVVDNLLDQVLEASGGGTDTVRATVNYQLMPGVSIEVLSAWDALATTAFTLTGNELVNTIIGNAGANVFFGGGGADTFSGLGGNDVYYVEDSGAQIIEASGNGSDILLTNVNYVLADGVFVESLSSRDWSATYALSITGNALANVLVGNAGANVLDGGGGTDILQGLGGNDTYVVDNLLDQILEASGGGTDTVRATVNYQLMPGVSIEVLSAWDPLATTAFTLTGNELANTIIGNAGANVFFGGGGADTFSGLGGNDVFYVEDSGAQIIEASGDGSDILLTNVNYVLADGVYVESLSSRDWLATYALNITGNSLANVLVGNAGANVLDGGGGVDILQGLGGNDTYVVDNLLDQVLESAGGGTDTVRATISFALMPGISIEVLSAWDPLATTAFTLTGNELANTIIGNAGANVFFSGGGADTFSGLGGNDRYYIQDSATQLVEASDGGDDILLTSVDYVLADGVYVESLSARDWSATYALNITGNSLANVIVGNAGANVLDGGGGADTLQGQGGSDTFAFTSALGAGNVDIIKDFASGGDKIALEDSVFAGLGAFPGTAFVVGASAADADDRIIYNPTSGALSFDADGNGAGLAVQFALLHGAPAVAHSDFVII